MYYIIRHLLKIDVETTHNLLMWVLPLIYGRKKTSTRTISVSGINFANRIGLAAGFDKYGTRAQELANIGFGHIEVGTVTPSARIGNKKRRWFLTKNNGMINNMGLNNPGINRLIHNISKYRLRNFVLGVSIGRDPSTSSDTAWADYVYCFLKVYNLCDYVTINISCPNVEGYTKLSVEDVRKIFSHLIHIRNRQQKRIPIFVKLSPSLSHEEVKDICELINEFGIDGVICCNLLHGKENDFCGGISGPELFDTALSILHKCRKSLNDNVVLIFSGGVDNIDTMKRLVNEEDVSLVQIFTGFVYQGPKLIKELRRI